MKNRNLSYKIPDIKAVRALTRLLGKLEVPSLYYTYEDMGYVMYCTKTNSPIDENKRYMKAYGYGLLESKLFVEKLFNYTTRQLPAEVPCMPYPRD